ncbi:hypothetical protein F4775DRAFT_475238 [Biscogniauxia sp. FL1348]|nr:hypothetical protein F4775DRAFT_475238 [Biscogniauxia sp. FL1348]
MAGSNSSTSAVPFFGAESSAPRAALKEFTFKCPQNTDPEPELVILDPDGDLHLIVGETKCILDTTSKQSKSRKNTPQSNRTTNHTHQNSITFLVCSKTLSRVSRVWKRLLYGGFRESKPANGAQWKVHLPEDSPEPMTTILNIIHSQFKDIPSDDEITLGVFYRIVIVAEKYDVIHVIQPWCDRWVAATGLLTMDPDEFSEKDVNRGMQISWAIGMTEIYTTMVLLVAENSRVDANGRLAYTLPWGKFEIYALDESIVKIPGIDDLITETRMCMIKSLLQWLREFQENPPLGTKKLRCGCKDRQCINETIGSLVTSMVNNGLWPVPDPSDFRDSPKSLEIKMSSQPKHRRCEASLKHGLAQALDVVGAGRIVANSLKDEKARRMKISSSINHRDEYR